MMRANLSAIFRLSRFFRHLSRALLVLALGLIGLSAAPAPDLAVSLVVQACNDLEAGNLDAVDRHLHTLRKQVSPQDSVVRMLEALLALQREQPGLDRREAFVQAWNSIGRPDFREAPLLPKKEEHSATPDARGLWGADLLPETRFVLALSLPRNAERARFVIEHLPKLEEPELIVAAYDYLQREDLPQSLRSESSAALRTRLAGLATTFPDAMHFHLLLLLGETSGSAPFTPGELQQLEDLSRRSDWRRSSFASITAYARGHLEKARLEPVENYAYTLAVCTLTSHAIVLLQRRTQASHEVLSASERHRLGEALWRIGERMSEESTLLEALLGLGLMKKGAIEMEDSVRELKAVELLAEERAAMQAAPQAALFQWPLPALHTLALEHHYRDERGFLRTFLPPKSEPSPAQ